MTTVAAGEDFSCALLSSGGAKCWGHNDKGQIGYGLCNDSNANCLNPTDVFNLFSATSITSGFWHSCSRIDNGRVKCWGYNAFGQLGTGDTQSQPSAFEVCATGAHSSFNCTPLTGVASVSAGHFHNCAVTNAGGVKCWGRQDSWQLGIIGTTASQRNPVDVCSGEPPDTPCVSLLSGISSVSAGGQHTCALTNTGGVKCWGNNNSGQLGNRSSLSDGCVPELSGLLCVAGSVPGLSGTATAIAAGGKHTCALMLDGSVMCWGDNSVGQLGNGTTGGTSSTPVAVSGLTGVAAISSKGDHTCALVAGGTLKCWGSNAFGELGGGSTGGSSNAPVDVIGFG